MLFQLDDEWYKRPAGLTEDQKAALIELQHFSAGDSATTREALRLFAPYILPLIRR
jgi:hypothetical protein